MLDPKTDIAKGYETITLTLADGRVVSGVGAEETESLVRLKQVDGQLVEIPVSEIDDRSAPNSAMPTRRRTPSPDELRDLVEFLATARKSRQAFELPH